MTPGTPFSGRRKRKVTSTSKAHLK